MTASASVRTTSRPLDARCANSMIVVRPGRERHDLAVAERPVRATSGARAGGADDGAPHDHEDGAAEREPGTAFEEAARECRRVGKRRVIRMSAPRERPCVHAFTLSPLMGNYERARAPGRYRLDWHFRHGAGERLAATQRPSRQPNESDRGVSMNRREFVSAAVTGGTLLTAATASAAPIVQAASAEPVEYLRTPPVSAPPRTASADR